MSFTISKKVTLRWRLNPTPFTKANAAALGERTRKIGSSLSGVAKMMSNSLEQEAIMKTVIGADPRSMTSNWTKLLQTYWDSLTVDIPMVGKVLETGWIFDYTASDKEKMIATLPKSVKDDKTLAKHVMSVISEEDKYKYGVPIEPAEYMLWRYCLVYRDVANSHEDVNKSGHIRFYLYSQEEIEASRKSKFTTKKKAMETFIQLLADKDKVDSIVYIGICDNSMVAPDGKTFNTLDETDKHMMLEGFLSSDPNKFVSIAEDANLAIKATIERYIFTNIFKRLVNSSVIVDAADSAIIIGNSIDEAVSYMSNQTNTKVLAEYKARYKGLPKT